MAGKEGGYAPANNLRLTFLLRSLSHLSMLWCGLRPGVGKKLASVQAAKSAPQSV